MKKIPPHSLFFTNCPPPAPRRVAKVVRPRPGEPIDVIVYSAHVWGLITHWINGRTKPCLKDQCPCKKPENKLRSLWKGYVLAATYDAASQLVIPEISVEAAWKCKELQGTAQVLRGARLKLRRANSSPNSAVIPELTLNVRPDWPAPPLDLVEALSRVWFGVKPQEQRIAEEWFRNLGEDKPTLDQGDKEDGTEESECETN